MTLPLPAHRYTERKKADKQRTWAYDFDGTITGAPDQLARIAQGLKALGDRIVIVTGNKSPRADLVKQLAAYGFPYDDLIQYDDDGTDGADRAEVLDEQGAWGAFDNRVDRAVVFADVCPTLYLVTKPLKK